MDFPDDSYPNAMKSNNLRRSVSTFDLNNENQNTTLREAKSFTGALPELKAAENRMMTMHQMFSDSPTLMNENEYITKEISTDEIFVVKQDMLNYRGTQYSIADIATRWKKDCRMWLWKNAKNRKNRSVTDIRELVQTMRLPTSADSIKRMF